MKVVKLKSRLKGNLCPLVVPKKVPKSSRVSQRQVWDGCVTNGVLSGLISKTCRVYQLSPLWGFETSARALKMYSEQVTKLLEGKHRARSFVGVVTVVKDFGSEGSFCVMVTVRQRDAAARSPGAVFAPCMSNPWQHQCIQGNTNVSEATPMYPRQYQCIQGNPNVSKAPPDLCIQGNPNVS